MRREFLAAGAVLVALGLAALFWLMAPSVEPVEPPESVVAGEDALPPPVPRPVDRDEEDEDPLGPRARPDEEDEVLDPSLVGKGRTLIDERGIGTKRMRALLRELEAVQTEPVPPGATPAEEDAVLARPIAKKAKILDDLNRDALLAANRENPVVGARAQLILAQAHEHMAGFFREQPPPSYLEPDGADQYLDALEERALTQEDQAAAARAAAREAASKAPADHPIHDRVE